MTAMMPSTSMMSSTSPSFSYRSPVYEKAPLTLNTMSPAIKNTLDAWLKYGTVFLIYRLCSYFFLETDPDAVLFDECSLRLVLLILVGFTIYYLLVDPFITFKFKHPIIQNIFSDTMTFGTVLISSHLMETYISGGNYFDMEWLKTAGIILIAFATYRVFVNPFIPLETMGPTANPIISDWAQFGTFLIAFRLLRGQSVLDQKWILSVLFALLGFTGYHLITEKLILIQ